MSVSAFDMLSSLLRPRRSPRRVQDHFSFASPEVDGPGSTLEERRARHASADFTESGDDDESTETDEMDVAVIDEEEDEDEDEGDEDGGDDYPLLPLFSAAHLDSIPIYNLTHTIRLIVVPRTETTLTWDQLRSPQVSQFLIKPMQQQIRSSHFSRATIYALMANCLQFRKESEASPGNAGTSRTRAMVCELLAVKLLKEYNTRELIDALSYDFFPLQGLGQTATPAAGSKEPTWQGMNVARVSALEVAIRASAKHLLAHPLVVQQLEAIWAGTIVFHSAADNLHRQHSPRYGEGQKPRDGAMSPLLPNRRVSYGTANPPDKPQTAPQVLVRRTVTLYNPREASLFKLSRLRVPRYRQFFSTCSLAILLCLFVAVLSQRSTDITTLEVIFWFWSAGFMLDEVVGFNEQGFSLYIMSFWNTFDVGILMLLGIYYCMRLYGIFLVDVGRHEWNDMAYDVLAANAILLFPRLFSVLDHYRYFSQLLIAFRLMAVDLMAVFILILIACSGFFVAFTLSFGENEYDAGAVAYHIFQILMGFTPAAWEAWPTYNLLGKAILVLFLFICHFLVVTILITVLTNSFMTIVSNANEEHQFVFAVNTISMVKNDALFSYVAPSNIFAWILTPLRIFLPFRSFIKANRTVIKMTHFPLLFSIYAYERLFLVRDVFEATDLIDSSARLNRLGASRAPGAMLFSPSVRLRQESVTGYQKDNALDEVFRQRPRGEILQEVRRATQQTYTAVDNWMDRYDGVASSPLEQPRSVVDRLEKRRNRRRSSFMKRGASRDISGTRSVVSDPADLLSSRTFHGHRPRAGYADIRSVMQSDADGDGDDELLTNDENEDTTAEKEPDSIRSILSHSHREKNDSYFPPSTPKARLHVAIHSPRKGGPSTPKESPPKRRPHHRTVSTSTILYNPVVDQQQASSPIRSRPTTAHRHQTNPSTPISSGHRTPRHFPPSTANVAPRPILPPRDQTRTMPDINTVVAQRTRGQGMRHRLSSLDMGMSDLGLDTENFLGMVPNSFATQMAMATGGLQGLGVGLKGGGRGGGAANESSDAIMGRLMLARMKTLEEGFAEVVREFRGSALGNSRGNSRGNSQFGTNAANSSAEGVGRSYEEKVGGVMWKHRGDGDVSKKRRKQTKPLLERSASEVHLSKKTDNTAEPAHNKGKGVDHDNHAGEGADPGVSGNLDKGARDGDTRGNDDISKRSSL